MRLYNNWFGNQVKCLDFFINTPDIKTKLEKHLYLCDLINRKKIILKKIDKLLYKYDYDYYDACMFCNYNNIKLDIDNGKLHQNIYKHIIENNKKLDEKIFILKSILKNNLFNEKSLNKIYEHYSKLKTKNEEVNKNKINEIKVKENEINENEINENIYKYIEQISPYLRKFEEIYYNLCDLIDSEDYSYDILKIKNDFKNIKEEFKQVINKIKDDINNTNKNFTNINIINFSTQFKKLNDMFINFLKKNEEDFTSNNDFANTFREFYTKKYDIYSNKELMTCFETYKNIITTISSYLMLIDIYDYNKSLISKITFYYHCNNFRLNYDLLKNKYTKDPINLSINDILKIEHSIDKLYEFIKKFIYEFNIDDTAHQTIKNEIYYNTNQILENLFIAYGQLENFYFEKESKSLNIIKKYINEIQSKNIDKFDEVKENLLYIQEILYRFVEIFDKTHIETIKKIPEIVKQNNETFEIINKIEINDIFDNIEKYFKISNEDVQKDLTENKIYNEIEGIEKNLKNIYKNKYLLFYKEKYETIIKKIEKIFIFAKRIIYIPDNKTDERQKEMKETAIKNYKSNKQDLLNIVNNHRKNCENNFEMQMNELKNLKTNEISKERIKNKKKKNKKINKIKKIKKKKKKNKNKLR